MSAWERAKAAWRLPFGTLPALPKASPVSMPLTALELGAIHRRSAAKTTALEQRQGDVRILLIELDRVDKLVHVLIRGENRLRFEREQARDLVRRASASAPYMGRDLVADIEQMTLIWEEP